MSVISVRSWRMILRRLSVLSFRLTLVLSISFNCQNLFVSAIKSCSVINWIFSFNFVAINSRLFLNDIAVASVMSLCSLRCYWYGEKNSLSLLSSESIKSWCLCLFLLIVIGCSVSYSGLEISWILFVITGVGVKTIEVGVEAIEF